MPPASNLDWLYHLLGYTLAAIGLALLLWSLCWDRSHKPFSRGDIRRRCPRCWYDMSGTPGLRCSECGRQARSERRLHKTRRRWRWAVPALVVLALAYATYNVPRYRAGGWASLIPSTYLVYFAPAKEVPDPSTRRFAIRLGLAASPFSSGSPAPADPLLDEVWTRITAGSLARWQSQAYLRRVMRSQGIDPDDPLRTPKVWPLGIDIPCKCSGVAGLDLRIGPRAGMDWKDPRTWLLSARRSPATSVDADLSLQTFQGLVVYSRHFTLPIDIHTPADSFLTRIDSPEATSGVVAALNPYLAENDDHLELILYQQPDPDARKRLPFIIAFKCEIRAGDRILATKSDDAPWKPNNWVFWSASYLDWPKDALDLLRDGKATITIRGDYSSALSVYTRTPFDPPPRSCWTGQFTAPVPLKAHPRKK